MNAASQLEAMRQRLEEAAADLDSLRAERTTLIKVIGERIGADATGESPYPTADRKSDQKAASALSVQIEQAGAGVEAISEACANLERRVAEQEASDISAEMNTVEGDGLAALRQFEESAQSFLDAANRLNNLQQRFNRLWNRRNGVLRNAGLEPVPEARGGLPQRWAVGGAANLESEVKSLPRFTRDHGGLKAWWAWA